MPLVGEKSKVVFPETEYCVVGLDLSISKTGIAVNTRDGLFIYTVPTEKMPVDRFNRQIHISSSIVGFIRAVMSRANTDKVKVFIEDYAFSMKSSSVTGLAELGGIVKADLYMEGFDITCLSRPSVVKFITGNGHKKKPDVMRGLYKQFGLYTSDFDEADALATFLYGYFMLHPEYRDRYLNDIQKNFIDQKANSTVKQKGKEKNESAT